MDEYLTGEPARNGASRESERRPMRNVADWRNRLRESAGDIVADLSELFYAERSGEAGRARMG